MAAVFNDGTIPYGSRVITITGSVSGTAFSSSYIADDIEVNQPTMIIPRTNHLNEPTGSVIIADFVEGSANLQMASAATAVPPPGSYFVDNITGTSSKFVLTETGVPEAKDQDKKVRVSFRKTYN